MRINFPKKPRKEGIGLFTTDGTDVVVGKDWALQNEIYDTIDKTKSRSCFRECRTCGACANSKRDETYPKSYDAYQGKSIDCRACEPFRFHDCHNGVMRNSHGEAEPFTEDQVALMKKTGSKPLI